MPGQVAAALPGTAAMQARPDPHPGPRTARDRGLCERGGDRVRKGRPIQETSVVRRRRRASGRCVQHDRSAREAGRAGDRHVPRLTTQWRRAMRGSVGRSTKHSHVVCILVIMLFLSYATGMPRGWEYTIKQAANLCSVSADTIKRRLRSGDLPHAHQLTDSARTWVIPLADLVAAGFTITGGGEQPTVGMPSRTRPTPAPGSDHDARVALAVAQAESAVHARYAQAFQDLALEAIRADSRRVSTRRSTKPEKSAGPAVQHPSWPA